MALTSVRLRSRAAPESLAALAGMCPGDDAYDLLLDGPCEVLLPDGRPLCVYLPGALAGVVTPAQLAILRSLRGQGTDNRGLASGSRRTQAGQQSRTRSRVVASAIIGAVDPAGQARYCRLTAWTGRHLPEWRELQPLLAQVGALLAAHVPVRWQAQMGQISATHPDWVVPGTPFTTVTVNNTYATGCHTDKGDLEAGFSTLFALRYGPWTGGRLVFPEWRTAADLDHGGLLLMDAHQWHGNTPITCACAQRRNGPCAQCGAERISVVSYMRARLTGCGTEAEETARAQRHRERTSRA